MDKKKIGFFALLIGMAFIIIGIVINTLNNNDSKKEAAPVATESEHSGHEDEGHDQHAEYIQDEDKDPFGSITAETGELSVDTINFDFELLTGTSYPRTAATLIDSSEHYLLYHNYNDVLSFYDDIRKEKKVIDEYFNQAIVTPDESYIIYTKNAFNKETFYYLDLKTLQIKEFYTYFQNLRMQVIDMKYANHLLYFLVRDTESGKTSVHFTTLPSKNDSFTTAQRESVIDIQTQELYAFNEKVYAFNEKTNTIDEIAPLTPPIPLMEFKSEKVKRIRSVDFYDDKKWVVAIENQDNQYVLITPTQKITTFSGLMSAHWFDENHIVVNDNLSLYLYNLETNENHVMKPGISYVFPTLDKLTVQTNDGNILILKKK